MNATDLEAHLAAITPDAIDAAAKRIAAHATVTPLLEAHALSQRLGGRVFVKPECLQRTGSFKFRAALNKIALIPDERRAAGVVAFSSGNHAQGVAAAAGLFGMKATIVMPADAPRIKRENTAALGATLRLYDRDSEDRAAIADALVAETGATLVPPYDDPDVIVGQGTVGLEIADACAARGLVPDAAIVCCGGGGLTTGTATALKARFPDVEIYSAEPAEFDDTARSLAAGERLPVPAGAKSICDALLSPMPGRITFEIAKRLLAGGVSVTDAEAMAAMRMAFNELKLVVEPGGAVALAATMLQKIPVEGRTVVAVISGGNVDPDMFAQAIGAGGA